MFSSTNQIIDLWRFISLNPYSRYVRKMEISGQKKKQRQRPTCCNSEVFLSSRDLAEKNLHELQSSEIQQQQKKTPSSGHHYLRVCSWQQNQFAEASRN